MHDSDTLLTVVDTEFHHHGDHTTHVYAVMSQHGTSMPFPPLQFHALTLTHSQDRNVVAVSLVEGLAV